MPPAQVCECGWKLRRYGEKSLARHKRGSFHRYAALTTAMLETDCITHVQIAARLGVTRERVRQIANTVGFKTGRERQAVCTMRRLNDSPRMKKISAAVPGGFKIEPVGLRSRVILVNDYRCLVRKACWHFKEKRRKKYVHINGVVWAKGDFILYEMPDNLGWLVVPKEKGPMYPTMFSMNPEKSGAHSYRHDLPTYLNAWHLLAWSAHETTKTDL